MQQNSPAHPSGVWRKNCEFAASPMDRTEVAWTEPSTGLELSSKSPWDVLREDSREKRELWKNLS